MSSPSSIKAPSSINLTSDDRREWIRIEDSLLLEYRLLTDAPDAPAPGLPPVTQEMIADAVGKPTTELLAHSGEILASSPLLPWIMKVDWLLEAMLKTLATLHPDCVAIARVTNVNISGGGVSFASPRRFNAGDHLALKLILPPFTPIQTIGKITRIIPDQSGQNFTVATQFLDLAADDQEHIIRHIIQVQAERLRARRQTS